MKTLGISFRWLLSRETLRLGVGNSATRTNRTIMRVVTPCTGRRLTLRKCDWIDPGDISPSMSAFPYPREPGANFLRDRKKIYIRCVCSYIYLCRTEHAYINYNTFDKCVYFNRSMHNDISGYNISRNCAFNWTQFLAISKRVTKNEIHQSLKSLIFEQNILILFNMR